MANFKKNSNSECLGQKFMIYAHLLFESGQFMENEWNDILYFLFER